MLRATVINPHIARPLLLTTTRHAFGYTALRTLSSSSIAARPASNETTTVGKGSEDPHPTKKDIAPLPPAQTDEFPTLHGSWTLFQPTYTEEELRSVKVLHRESKTMSDRIAALFVACLRTGFDIVSRYKHKPIPPNVNMPLAELRKGGYVMNPQQWLYRIIFLETLAGVPGMVAASLRHLRSLRLMKRDAGWIHTLLEESENERMHLMTFMTLHKPSIWLRALILTSQGVFYNAFFFSYLISPKTCHRFVGKLEEEAVYTYTRVIEEMEKGWLPEWDNVPAPSIAVDYWRLKPDAKLLDVIKAVRADEATHRFVNHSLAGLNQAEDVNPFAIVEPDMILKGTKVGLERSEAAEFVRNTQKMLQAGEAKQVEDKHQPLQKSPLE